MTYKLVLISLALYHFYRCYNNFCTCHHKYREHPAARVVASYPVGQSQFGIVYQATMVNGNIYEVKLNAAASQMPAFSPVYEQMVNSFQIMK